ncbi:hypothetical protein DUI87_06975 [Hirundo rustica rustica]|uniref:Uncharacterized protein n=1 Tax=Hirundo rustica rustica TaxID=333673 RepID=A0A3M0KNI4_HIRRU|nr:hypothetical protein DUI87_06975 [Hirundo rustica rustica]
MLFKEMVAIPSLEVFQAKLDGALSNLVKWKFSLPMAEELELNDLYDCFQPKLFYDSMFYDSMGLLRETDVIGTINHMLK